MVFRVFSEFRGFRAFWRSFRDFRGLWFSQKAYRNYEKKKKTVGRGRKVGSGGREGGGREGEGGREGGREGSSRYVNEVIHSTSTQMRGRGGRCQFLVHRTVQVLRGPVCNMCHTSDSVLRIATRRSLSLLSTSLRLACLGFESALRVSCIHHQSCRCAPDRTHIVVSCPTCLHVSTRLVLQVHPAGV